MQLYALYAPSTPGQVQPAYVSLKLTGEEVQLNETTAKKCGPLLIYFI
jgi:hypothetical protein